MLLALLLACQNESPPPPAAAPAPTAPVAPAPPPAPKGPALADLPHEGDMSTDRSPAFLVFQPVKGGCGLVAHRGTSGAFKGLVGIAEPCPTERAGVAVSADAQKILLWGQKPDGLWEADLSTGVATALPIPEATTPLWMGYTKDGGVALFTSVNAELTTAGQVTSLTLAGKTYEVKDAPVPPGERAVVGWKRGADGAWAFSAVGEADTKADRFRRVPGLTLPLFAEITDRATPDRWVCPVGPKADAGESRALKGKETSKTGFWQDVPAECPAAMWVNTPADTCPSTAAIWAKGKSGWSSRISLAEGATPSNVRTLGPRTLVEAPGGAQVIDLCGDAPERKIEGAFAGLWPMKHPLPGVAAANPAAANPTAGTTAPTSTAPPPTGTAPAGSAPAVTPPSTAPAAAP